MQKYTGYHVDANSKCMVLVRARQLCTCCVCFSFSVYSDLSFCVASTSALVVGDNCGHLQSVLDPSGGIKCVATVFSGHLQFLKMSTGSVQRQRCQRQ